MFYKRLFLINTFINENDIIKVTNVRRISKVANIYGYIRVSTKDQNEQRQLHKMMERGVEARRIFVDKASGRHFNHPQYQLLRKILSTGDIVYVDALDRMGRNYDEVISEWKYITRELQADIIVLENETLFDSRKFRDMGDMGRLMEDQFLSLLSYVADQERKKIHQRQAEGIAVAKSQGKHLGRPQCNLSTLNQKQLHTIEETYPKWKNREITGVQFMELLELKKNTFYKIMKEYEESKL
ncbi:recombinase family protein [Bacillus albus]|uniref:recombinase family protein n=1 Tax=Bacillus albus TaxID=2026189 RepID=UPI000BA4AB56|nr:recombinase family protein [Bacillus albus]MDC6157463.1 recombinase family protein [Bacillus albus]MDD8006940.1 recombinase family protein [Bacillus albus]